MSSTGPEKDSNPLSSPDVLLAQAEDYFRGESEGYNPRLDVLRDFVAEHEARLSLPSSKREEWIGSESQIATVIDYRFITMANLREMHRNSLYRTVRGYCDALLTNLAKSKSGMITDPNMEGLSLTSQALQNIEALLMRLDPWD